MWSLENHGTEISSQSREHHSLGTWLVSLSSNSSPVAQAWNIDIKYIFKIVNNLEQKEEVLKHKGQYLLWQSVGSTIKSGLRAEDGQSTALCPLFLLTHPATAVPVSELYENAKYKNALVLL